jgi:hypothetical protein
MARHNDLLDLCLAYRRLEEMIAPFVSWELKLRNDNPAPGEPTPDDYLAVGKEIVRQKRQVEQMAKSGKADPEVLAKYLTLLDLRRKWERMRLWADPTSPDDAVEEAERAKGVEGELAAFDAVQTAIRKVLD